MKPERNYFWPCLVIAILFALWGIYGPPPKDPELEKQVRAREAERMQMIRQGHVCDQYGCR